MALAKGPRPDVGPPMVGRIVEASKDAALANVRGWLVVRPAPAPKRGLYVRVTDEFGARDLVRLDATRAEMTWITAPARDGSRRTEDFPGTLWFYDESGARLAFLPDAHAGALALPMAVESKRKVEPDAS